MILKKIKLNKDIKSVVNNFFSLSVLNGINYIFPLILIPYLTRTLGVENYGVYAFAFAVFQYLLLIVRYGFDFSATKEVAIIRDDKLKLSRYFSTIILLRFLLAITAIVILIILVAVIPKFNQEKVLFIYGSGILIGTALLPIWFFQGMEKMKFITIVNFISKFMALILILSFVKKENDYANVVLFQSIGYLVAAIMSFYFALRILKVNMILPTYLEIKSALIEGKNIFISTLGMNFYRESNVIILSFLTNFTIVGYYAAAEKIIKAAQSLTSPFVQSIFPYMGRKMNLLIERDNAVKQFRKIAKYYGFFLILLVFIFIFAGNYITHLVLGEGFEKSYLNVRILSLILFFGGMNYYYGIVGLVNIGKDHVFKISVLVAGVTSVIFCLISVNFLEDLGATLAMVIAEVVLFAQVFYHFNKRLKSNL